MTILPAIVCPSQSIGRTTVNIWLKKTLISALASTLLVGTAAAGDGATDVVLAPLGFISDHMEVLFDLDYPGHYLRRLKSVGLTIPCVTGPYTGVSCTLANNAAP